MAKQFGAEVARSVFDQWALRTRAKAKFARAEEMLFDREGLEMATHERVAEFHASLFPPDEHIVDMTCGLGADLIAFARRGLVTGYDTDADRLRLARHNLEVHGLDACLVQHTNGSDLLEYAFADPARRSGGKRVSRDGDAYEPPLDELVPVLSKAKGAALKLSPLLDDRLLESLGGQVVFVSYDRECREALVLYGVCRREKPATAVHIESGEWLEGGEQAIFGFDSVGSFFYEADPAAIRAHSLGVLCEKFDLRPLGDSGGYLTGEAEVCSPWLRGFRVHLSGKADVAATKSKLAELESATPVVKQRAAGIDVVKIQKQLKLSGRRPLIVAVWPVGKSLRHTILEPLP